MRYSADQNVQTDFTDLLAAAQREPVFLEKNKEDIAVILSARQHALLSKSAKDDFDALCERMSAEAISMGLTEES